jgi:hypothetical protein
MSWKIPSDITDVVKLWCNTLPKVCGDAGIDKPTAWPVVHAWQIWPCMYTILFSFFFFCSTGF